MYDLYGLGNALVDMEYTIEDSFLSQNDIPKGHMTLVDEPRLLSLIDSLEALEPARLSGGSAANSIIASQALGSSCFYSCKVNADEIGDFFVTDMRNTGVVLNDNAQANGDHSGRCLVLITPDAERSMNTYLGISSTLAVEQVNTDALKASRYFYTEGYLSSSETAMAAAIACREVADAHDVKTCVSLSDPSMVEFFGDNLKAILGNGVHMIFCNEEEALTLTGTDRLDVAMNELTDMAHQVHVTLGAKGSHWSDGKNSKTVAGYPVQAIDTNGAGDAFAGACLHGLISGMEPAIAARLGNHAAAAVVSQFGARLHSVADYQKMLKAFTP
ncbi:MAG: adenosine kinase [Pseudomonadales bacterium]